MPTSILAVDREMRVAYANARAVKFFDPESVQAGAPIPRSPLGPDLEAFAVELFDRAAGSIARNFVWGEETIDVTGIAMDGDRIATLYINDSASVYRQRAQSEFLANAAHELLTPLTGIVSAAHVLDAGAKEVPEMRDRFLSHIAREASRLTRIARGLLVLARAQSGQESPPPEAFALETLLGDVIAGMPGGVTIDCPADLEIFADRDLVETALTNLVANAIRHSSDGTASVVASVNGGRFVAIVITNVAYDTSTSDPTQFQQRFMSGSGRDGAGFGLGISIAGESLRAAGGSLTFEQEADRTLAVVALPVGG
jgi:signal transduction histidine kinase